MCWRMRKGTQEGSAVRTKIWEKGREGVSVNRHPGPKAARRWHLHEFQDVEDLCRWQAQRIKEMTSPSLKQQCRQPGV